MIVGIVPKHENMGLLGEKASTQGSLVEAQEFEHDSFGETYIKQEGTNIV